MNRYSPIIAGLIIILVVALGGVSCLAEPPARAEQARSLMGTFVTVTVYAGDETEGNEAINAAFVRMEEIEKIASIYDEESQASRLNRDGYLDSPTPEFLELMTLSADYSRLTDGAFDITVQPLLELWSGGLWQESPEVQQSRIDDTLELVGWDKVAVSDDSISFDTEGMAITLGGIAKGYATDQALAVLADMGIEHALVNAGGDMTTLDAKPDGEPWQVALVNPDDTSQSLATFAVSGQAIATSGNYERYFDPEKQAHHIIHPKTGYSANECISVTIVADNGTAADALATSVFVLGPEDGMALVESLDGVECLIVDNDREIYRSSQLSRYEN